MQKEHAIIEAKKDRKCYLCKEKIKKGERCLGIKSLSYGRYAGCHFKHFTREYLDSLMVDNI